MGQWRGRAYRADLYDGVASSGVTSNVEWIGDFDDISLFLRGSPSTTSIQLSNASGMGSSAIPETSWSDETQITSPSPDLLSVTAGARWIRTIRSETTEAVLNARMD